VTGPGYGGDSGKPWRLALAVLLLAVVAWKLKGLAVDG
jgi:hypothetical protein